MLLELSHVQDFQYSKGFNIFLKKFLRVIIKIILLYEISFLVLHPLDERLAGNNKPLHTSLSLTLLDHPLHRQRLLLHIMCDQRTGHWHTAVLLAEHVRRSAALQIEVLEVVYESVHIQRGYYLARFSVLCRS